MIHSTAPNLALQGEIKSAVQYYTERLVVSAIKLSQTKPEEHVEGLTSIGHRGGTLKKVLIGLGLVVVGCLLFVLWWQKFVQIIIGIIPLVCVGTGVLLLSAGIRQVENEKVKLKSGIHSVKQKVSENKTSE